MGTKRRILLHLAAAIAGWGIARPLLSPVPDAAEPLAPRKTSVRDSRDREAGEKLLRRLVPDLAPAPPVDVARHEGTLEERFAEATFDDPFADNPSTPSDDSITSYLRDQIRTTLFGRHGPDLSYAFLHGRMDASQVLDSLRRSFPDLAGEPQFPRAVFLELFSLDPSRATDLAHGLAPGEYRSWVGNTMLEEAWAMGPSGSLALLDLQLADAPVSGSFPLVRDPGDSAALHYDAYQDDYTEWLLQQPPTAGRRVMLGSWARHLRECDPAAAAALDKRLTTP